MGTLAAEPGRARARDAWRSRLARSSSASVSPLTSWLRLGSGTGDPWHDPLLGKVASVILAGHAHGGVLLAQGCSVEGLCRAAIA